jgi:hypothetical protein
MADELHAVILDSIELWAEQCEYIAQCEDPTTELMHLARNLRAARANLEVLYQRQYSAHESKPRMRRLSTWW